MLSLNITIIFMAMNVNIEQVQGQNIEDVKSQIVSLERNALEMWNKGNPDGYLNLYSDDVTYIPILKRNSKV